MASRFPDEGIDLILSTAPRGAVMGDLWLGFFTSQDAASVPDADAVLATQSGVTEANGSGYGRVVVPAASWGSPSAVLAGRRVDATQVEMSAVGAGGWGTVNGFFLADASTAGVAVLYANFDDETPIVTAQGDVIRVAPYWIARG